MCSLKAERIFIIHYCIFGLIPKSAQPAWAAFVQQKKRNDFVGQAQRLLTFLLCLISPPHLTEDSTVPLETRSGLQDSGFLLLILL